MNSFRKLTTVSLLRCPLTVAALLTPVLTVRADYSSTVLGDHPVAYYRFEDASGSATVADSSGNGFTGYVTYETQADGVTVFPQLQQPGIDSNSMIFATSTSLAGTQGHVDIPVNSTINPTLANGQTGAPFTAELWIQATTESTANFEVPLDDSSDFGQPPPYNNSAGWNIYQTQGPGSTWSYSLRPNPGFVGYGTAAVVIGQWAHLVLSYDGTNATFYVNGVQIRKDPIPQFLANNGAEDLIVGEGPATGFAAFDGYVDEVAIYNYPLTSTQVTNHYIVGTNEIRAVPTPPSFSLEPNSATNYSGVPVTFASQALGTTPLSYQWVRQGTGAILGATNNNYTFTPQYPGDNNAIFYVTVTNIAGSTNSAPVTLTVLTNLNMNYPPFSITRRVGSHAAFRVAANGALPITYQWHCISNSVDQPLFGQTADTLWLTNIQLSANDTVYYAAVTGPFASASSAQATLLVVPRTNYAPVTVHSMIVMADNPVAYWRLDESGTNEPALDAAGSFDGVYSDPAGTFIFNYPTGISNETDAAIHITNTAIVTIPYALELNPVTGPWSVEFWIQPTSLSGNFPTPISSEGNPVVDGMYSGDLSGWNIYQHAANVWTWNIYNGGPNGSFTSEFTDNPIVPGEWYHMVLTDDTTNMNWYSNDRFVFTTSTAAVNFVPNGINGDTNVAGGPLTIGIRSDGLYGDWDGGVDEVAVYNYVLSTQQIQNHYLNNISLTAVKSGSNVIVTWPAGTLQSSPNVNGPYLNLTGTNSPYTNSATATQFYRVKL